MRCYLGLISFTGLAYLHYARRHLRGNCGILILVLVSLSNPSVANNPQLQISTLDEIITIGTRKERAIKDLSYTLSILNTEDLSRALPRTLPESLNVLPGVLVQKTASGHGSPYIRGFTGNRTLAVIDGIRYNNATYRDGANEYFSHIDSFTLDQVEVLNGPASTLYGSEAVGGTIVLRTKDSGYLDQATGSAFLEGAQTFRVSSGDRSAISRTSAAFGSGQKWGVRIGASFKSFGDVRAADLGRLPETGYTEWAWDTRLDFAISSAWSATLAHQFLSQDDVPRTHSTTFSVPFAGTTAGTDFRRIKDQRRRLVYLQFDGAPELGFIDTASITFSYQPRHESERRIRGNGIDIQQSFDSSLWGLNTVFGGPILDLDLTFGLDLSHEAVDSERTDFDPSTQITTVRIQGPVGDNATYQQAGLFLQGVWPATERLMLEGGLRTSYIRVEIGRFADPQTSSAIRFDDDWSDLSGSFRISYALNKAAIWTAISRSFRAPNIADISRFGRSRSNEFEVASFGLEPERFNTAEIGVRYHITHFNLAATYYYTGLINYIDTVPTGRIVDSLFEVSKQNAASGKIQGVEIAGQWDLPHGFSLNANMTWLEGILTRPISGGGNVTEPISRIQPLTGHVKLQWENENCWISAEYTGVARADRLSAGDLLDTQRIPRGGTPGYNLFNFRAGWAVTNDVVLTLNVLNILDETYRSHGSGSNEPGRHILSGFTVKI